MNRSAHSITLGRIVIWTLVLASILTLSWFKDAENRRDREQQLAWREHLAVLQVESEAETKRLRSWLKSLSSHPDAKQEAGQELYAGGPLPLAKEGNYDVARWAHPKYGTQVELTFLGDNLVGTGSRSGTGLLQSANPQPPRRAFDSKAEVIRQSIITPAILFWFLALIVAGVSTRFGRIAAEFMLAASLVYGAARLLNPAYTVTLQGVFSNDSLVFAALMYVASIVLFARRWPRDQTTIRFSLRTLLAMTSVVAFLIAMKPVGYVAIAVFAVGAMLFVGLQSRQTNLRDSRMNSNADNV